MTEDDPKGTVFTDCPKIFSTVLHTFTCSSMGFNSKRVDPQGNPSKIPRSSPSKIPQSNPWKTTYCPLSLQTVPWDSLGSFRLLPWDSLGAFRLLPWDSLGAFRLLSWDSLSCQAQVVSAPLILAPVDNFEIF